MRLRECKIGYYIEMFITFLSAGLFGYGLGRGVHGFIDGTSDFDTTDLVVWWVICLIVSAGTASLALWFAKQFRKNT